jgi:hypothetical protein
MTPPTTMPTMAPALSGEHRVPIFGPLQVVLGGGGGGELTDDTVTCSAQQDAEQSRQACESRVQAWHAPAGIGGFKRRTQSSHAAP